MFVIEVLDAYKHMRTHVVERVASDKLVNH